MNIERFIATKARRYKDLGREFYMFRFKFVLVSLWLYNVIYLTRKKKAPELYIQPRCPKYEMKRSLVNNNFLVLDTSFCFHLNDVST